jgi:hypothetical protein
MQFTNRMPLVCSALEARKFQDRYNLALVDRRGPVQGANVYLQFALSTTINAVPHKTEPPKNTTPRTKPAPTPQENTVGKHVYLVSCVSAKRNTAVQGRHVFPSMLVLFAVLQVMNFTVTGSNWWHGFGQWFAGLPLS